MYVLLLTAKQTNKKANKTSSVPLMLYFTFDDGTKKVKFLFYFIMVYGKKEYQKELDKKLIYFRIYEVNRDRVV